MSTPPPPAHQPGPAPRGAQDESPWANAARPAPHEAGTVPPGNSTTPLSATAAERPWAATGQPGATVPAQGATPAAAPWGGAAATPQSAAGGPAPQTGQPTGTSPAQQPAASPWAASADSARAQSSPWAAQRRPQQERVTSRLRRVVEGLPDWEPLPPGETVVRRPGSTV
ncbi:hypothetical protein [Streptomyces sp. PTD9-10]|uniref:hypothetical protein n=1 Tax=Streptomyces sp. PTD9-10 TaxID=3120151 RepID=UPI00300B8E06